MSVGKNPQGRFYFSIRYQDNDGTMKQKKVESTEWHTRKEALKAENEFLLSYNQLKIKDISYYELYELYLHSRLTRIKERSIQTYSDVHKYQILPEFGTCLVSRINKDQIRRWQRNLLNKNFSNSYLMTVQSVFKRVLLWGERNDLIEKNPFTIEYQRVAEPKAEMLYYTLDEYMRFTSVIDDEIDLITFNLLYWCGLRKGELQGLSFNNIDLDKGVLYVRHNYDYRNHKLTTPKNKNSDRDVMLTEQLRTLLTHYIKKCEQLAGFQPDYFLIGIDKPISSTTLERKKNKYCQLARLKRIRIHDFRHSHVSLLINNGISDFDISKRLGHSRDMVNNTYGHWFTESQRKIANKLDQLTYEITQSANLKN